ncbi:hypothetical protein TNCV_1679151 [Trichonephila clavipes]|nr:hypothetical protein TNCV_1679151 [Trichonephila clavipes]
MFTHTLHGVLNVPSTSIRERRFKGNGVRMNGIREDDLFEASQAERPITPSDAGRDAKAAQSEEDVGEKKMPYRIWNDKKWQPDPSYKTVLSLIARLSREMKHKLKGKAELMYLSGYREEMTAEHPAPISSCKRPTPIGAE